MGLTRRELADLIARGGILDDITRLELAGHSTVSQLEALDRKSLAKLSGGPTGPVGVRRALGALLDRAVEQQREQ